MGAQWFRHWEFKELTKEMLYTTLSEEANDLGRSSSCERVIQLEKMTNYQNIIGGCFAGASESEGSGNGFYTGTKLFVHFSA